MKTPIRWAGSKKALLPQLRAHWRSTHRRYIEPFCGSACLFFDLEPQEAILSDVNEELINAYRAIRTTPSLVIECLQRLVVSETEYYSLRQVEPSLLSPPELAARFLFINRLCFNGIYRTNLSGRFNVPYARPKSKVIFDIDTLVKMSNTLKKATLIVGDFEQVLDEAEEGDFVYLDPPYAVRKRRVFSEYHPDSFLHSDILRLRETLIRLHDRRVHFVISYADSPEGRLITGDWKSKRTRTRRNVAGFAGFRRTAYEVMASNWELPDAYH